MKNILIFNDISGLGNCSMCANLPIFTKLGHYCMPVVTATFSCQTGFENYTVQCNENLQKCAKEIVANRTPDAIYVGFCATTSLLRQATEIAQQNGTYLFVDTILGDNGKLYKIFDQTYLDAMKQLVPLAQCISPNLTEACLLADVDYAQLVSHKNEPTFLAICGNAFCDFLQKTGAHSAVITGIECGNMIGNVVLQRGQPVRYVTNERVNVNYSGTGDAFSSVVLGQLLNGCSLVSAVQVAADFVCKAAQRTNCRDRRFGVEISNVLNLL